MKTKYNIERQFIEGYNIVDPIDQATFQKQIELSFTGSTTELDLSKSNFFLADCELATGGTVNFDFINYDDKVQRFELLLQESLDIKDITFCSNVGGVDVEFPFKYMDDDGVEFDIEPMSQHQRRQMLISFRRSSLINDSVVFIGTATTWFESSATHCMVTMRVEEPVNEYVTNNLTLRRYPSNVYYTCKNSKTPALKIEENYTMFGLLTAFIHRIPDYYTDAQCKHTFTFTYEGVNGGELSVELTKEEVNSGIVNKVVELPATFVNTWYRQPSIPGEKTLFGYRTGDLVYLPQNTGQPLVDNKVFRSVLDNNHYKPSVYDALQNPMDYPPGSEAWENEYVKDYAYWQVWLPDGATNSWDMHPNAGDPGWYSVSVLYIEAYGIGNLSFWYVDPQPPTPPQ